MYRIRIKIAAVWDDSTLAEMEVELDESFSYDFPSEPHADDLKILEAIRTLEPQYRNQDKFRVYVQDVAFLADDEECAEWQETEESEQRKWYVDTDPDRVNSCDTSGWEIMDF